MVAPNSVASDVGTAPGSSLNALIDSIEQAPRRVLEGWRRAAARDAFEHLIKVDPRRRRYRHPMQNGSPFD